MSKLIVMGADGKSYELTVPEGLSYEEAMAGAKQRFPAIFTPPEPQAPLFPDFLGPPIAPIPNAKPVAGATPVQSGGDSFARQVADVPLKFGQGAVMGVRMIADAFGADNDASKLLKKWEGSIGELFSAQAKQDEQEIARIMQEAEGKGLGTEFRAALKALTVAPIDVVTNALGTMAPMVVAALGGKVLGAGALGMRALSGATAAVQGAGIGKDTLYQATYDVLIENGVPAERAKAAATEAQAYNGKNLDLILANTIAVGAAGTIGAEKWLANLIARRLTGKEVVADAVTEIAEALGKQAARTGVATVARGAAAEAVPEGIQGGLEKATSNIAQTRAGFPTDPFAGVVGSGTLEAAVAAPIGGFTAMRDRADARRQLDTVHNLAEGLGDLTGVDPGGLEGFNPGEVPEPTLRARTDSTPQPADARVPPTGTRQQRGFDFRDTDAANMAGIQEAMAARAAQPDAAPIDAPVNAPRSAGTPAQQQLGMDFSRTDVLNSVRKPALRQTLEAELFANEAEMTPRQRTGAKKRLQGLVNRLDNAFRTGDSQRIAEALYNEQDILERKTKLPSYMEPGFTRVMAKALDIGAQFEAVVATTKSEADAERRGAINAMAQARLMGPQRPGVTIGSAPDTKSSEEVLRQREQERQQVEAAERERAEFEQRLADTDTRVAAAAQQQRRLQARERALQEAVGTVGQGDPVAVFTEKLRSLPGQDATPTPDEAARLARAMEAAEAFTQPDIMPSSPNELSAEALGIPERAERSQPAPVPEPRQGQNPDRFQLEPYRDLSDSDLAAMEAAQARREQRAAVPEPDMGPAPTQGELPLAEPRPFTQATLRSLGIAPTNKTLQGLIGKDLNEPLQRREVEEAIQKYAAAPARSDTLRAKITQALTAGVLGDGGRTGPESNGARGRAGLSVPDGADTGADRAVAPGAGGLVGAVPPAEADNARAVDGDAALEGDAEQAPEQRRESKKSLLEQAAEGDQDALDRAVAAAGKQAERRQRALSRKKKAEMDAEERALAEDIEDAETFDADLKAVVDAEKPQLWTMDATLKTIGQAKTADQLIAVALGSTKSPVLRHVLNKLRESKMLSEVEARVGNLRPGEHGAFWFEYTLDGAKERVTISRQMLNTVAESDTPFSREILAEAIAHELIHAATIRVMTPTVAANMMVPMERLAKFSKDLDNIQANIKALLATKNNPVLETIDKATLEHLQQMAADVREIPTYGLTDPGVQAALQQMPSNVAKRSLWSKFVAAIKQLFGFSTDNTLLEDVLVISDQLITLQAGLSKKGAQPFSANTDAEKLSIYGGRNMSTVDLAQLYRADRMDKEGFDAGVIRLATGWFRGKYDGEWRKEVDDSVASLVAPVTDFDESPLFGQQRGYWLHEVLNHPKLYAAYPAARDIQFIVRKGFFDLGGLQGWYNPDKNQIGVTPYAKDPLGTILHEVQHWVQRQEGFAEGGNAESVIAALPEAELERQARKILATLTAELDTAATDLDILDTLTDHPAQLTQLIEAARATRIAWDTYYKASGLPQQERQALRDAWSKLLPAENAASDALLSAVREAAPKASGEDMREFRRVAKRIANAVKEDSSPEQVIDGVRRSITNTWQDVNTRVNSLRSGDSDALRAEIAKSGEAHSLYQRIAGEVEARDVAARAGYTVSDRQTTAPYSSEDIAAEDAFVFMGDKGVQPIGGRGESGIFKSVADIAKLKSERGTSLAALAARFPEWIATKDRKLEDASRIARDIVEEAKNNASAFIEQATEASVRKFHDRILRMPDGTLYDEDNLAHANASPEVVAVHNARNGGAEEYAYRLEEEANTLNSQRAIALSQLARYLEGNLDYDATEAATLIGVASKYGIRGDKATDTGEVVYRAVPITADNQTPIAVVDGGLASAVVAELRKGASVKAAMATAYTKQMKLKQANNKYKDGLHKFEQSDDEVAAIELNNACAGTPWCTGGSEDTARGQLSAGDFYVYYKDGAPAVAFRLNGQRALAEPPRGTNADQSLTPEQERIAEEVLRSGQVPGGEDFLADIDFIRAVQTDVTAMSDMDVFMGATADRRSASGYGENANKFPRSVYTALNKEIARRGLNEAKGFYTDIDATNAQAAAENAVAAVRVTGVPAGSRVVFRRLEATGDISDNKGDMSFPMLKTAGGIAHNKGNMSFPLLEAAGGIAHNKGNMSFPLLEAAGDIYRNESNMSFDRLKTAKYIGSNNGDMSFPMLKTAGGIAHNKGNMSFPLLEAAGDISGNKGDMSFDILKTVTNITGNNGDMSFPMLETAKYIGSNNGDMSFPMLETAENIYSNEGNLSFPMLEATGDISGNKGDMSFDRLKTANYIGDNNGDMSFPMLKTAGGIASNKGNMSFPLLEAAKYIGDNNGDMSFPMLKTAGGIAHNKGNMSFPLLEAAGDIYSNRGRLYAPRLRTPIQPRRDSYNYGQLAPEYVGERGLRQLRQPFRDAEEDTLYSRTTPEADRLKQLSQQAGNIQRQKPPEQPKKWVPRLLESVTGTGLSWRTKYIDYAARAEKDLTKIFVTYYKDAILDAEGNIRPDFLMRQADQIQQLAVSVMHDGGLWFDPEHQQFSSYRPKMRSKQMPDGTFEVEEYYPGWGIGAVGEWRTALKGLPSQESADWFTKHNASLQNIMHVLNSLAARVGSRELARELANKAFTAYRFHYLIKETATLRAAAEAAEEAGDTKRAAEIRDRLVTLPETVEVTQADGAKVKVPLAEAVAAGLALLDEAPELRIMQRQWMLLNHRLINVMEKSGRITPDTADVWRSHTSYISFARERDVLNTDGMDAKQLSRAMVDMKKLPEMDGPSDGIRDIFESMMQDVFWMTGAASRTEANRRMLDVMRTFLGKDIKKVDRSGKAQPSEWANVVTIFRNGQPELYELPEYEQVIAFKGAPIIQYEGIMKFFAGATNVLRKTVTANPEFAVSQLFQDPWRAPTAAQVRSPFKLMAGILGNFITELSGGSTTTDTLRAMGVGAQFDSLPGHAKEQVERVYDVSRHGKFLDAANSFLDRMAYPSMAQDMALRTATYQRVLEETGSKVKAAVMAREVINFNRLGSSKFIHTMRGLVPFLNAYIQGMDVQYRAALSQGLDNATARRRAMRPFIWTAMKLGGAMMLYSMLLGDDDQYDTFSDSERDRMLFIPESVSGIDGGLKLPVAPEMGFLYKGVFERVFRRTVGQYADNPREQKQLLASLRDGAVDVFTGPLPVPQLIKPMVEVATNYSFMKSGSLVGRRFEGVESWLQFDAATSEVSKAIGKATNTSPIKIDHILRAYFGVTGGMLLDLTTTALGEGPTQAVNRRPGVKLFRPPPEGGREFTDSYYRYQDDVLRAVNSVAELQNTHRMELAAEMIQDDKVLYRLAQKGFVQHGQELTAQFRKRRQLIENTPLWLMSRNDKRDALVELKREEQEAFRRFQTITRNVE